MARAICDVQVNDLHLTLEGKEILCGVSFSTFARRVGIVGRNGSGKSTLSRVLAGLISPTRGEVHVAGFDPEEDRAAAIKEIGILFQNPDRQIIFPTVLEEVAFGLRQLKRPNPEAQARAWLAAFGKTSWENVHCANLSQGQKHLLCLISIVAMNPKIIILDEPFAGLDIPTKAQLARHLARFDGGLIHISHDPRDLVDYDDFLWIDEGRLRAQGARDEVMEAYMAEMNMIGARDDISDIAD